MWRIEWWAEAERDGQTRFARPDSQARTSRTGNHALLINALLEVLDIHGSTVSVYEKRALGCFVWWPCMTINVCVCVCLLPIHSGHQVRWTYQPGSHRRKVTQDFSSTFFLWCVPLFFSREEFSHSFPSSTVTSNFVH